MISYTISKHAVAYPAKVLAREGGKHIYNIQLTSDRDNGNFVGKGAFIELDLYAEAAPTSFTGTVVAQADNGNYYVEVITADNALFVYQVPVIEEEYNRSFQLEENFYNPAKSTVRAYELAAGDIIELSELGFAKKPAVGASVSLSGNKLTD